MSNNLPIGTISSVSEHVSITDTELGLGPIPPYTRNWEFEKNLLPMWTPGNNLICPFPIEMLARTLLATRSPYVKLTSTLREDGIRCYRLESGEDAAEFSIRTLGNQTAVNFTPLGQCRVDTPAGDAMHNFVAGAIWWANHDWQASSAQPAERDGVPKITVNINNPNFGTQINAGGNVDIGGNVVNRDMNTNNTEVNIANKPTTE